MLETGLTFDIPTLLVDDEIIDYVLRMLAGFKVDATTLSTDPDQASRPLWYVPRRNGHL
ncbi:MAG: hypothetical protein V8Q84_05335 [Bilophila sp.]